MGCLVLYPLGSGHVPSEDQVAAALRILRHESVLDRELWPGTWCSGPAWERLGIATDSRPALISVRRPQGAVPAPWGAPVWARALACKRFYLTVRDCRVPGVSWEDPIWQQVQSTLGTDLFSVLLPV